MQFHRSVSRGVFLLSSFTCSKHHVSLNVTGTQNRTSSTTHSSTVDFMVISILSQVGRSQNKKITFQDPLTLSFFSVSTCGIFLLDLVCLCAIHATMKLSNSFHVCFIFHDKKQSLPLIVLLLTICLQCNAFDKLHN